MYCSSPLTKILLGQFPPPSLLGSTAPADLDELFIPGPGLFFALADADFCTFAATEALPFIISPASVPLSQLPTEGKQIAQNKHCDIATGKRSWIMVASGSATSALALK